MEHSALAQPPSTGSHPLANTSVHHQETTTPLSPPLSYRDRLLDSNWDEYVATLETYTALDQTDYTAKAFELQRCKTNAWFAMLREDRRVIVVSHSCRLRWCPLCSKARSIRVSRGVQHWLKSHPRPKLLTLTLRHSDDSLDSQVTRLYAAFQLLRRKKYISRSVRGGVWFFQVKWCSKTGQWHPHLHILLDSEFIPHAFLKSAWRKITGDSDIVDIRVIYNPKTAADYVARYASRPTQLSQVPRERRPEVVEALHSRRLLGKWGSAREIVFAQPIRSGDDNIVSLMRFNDVVTGSHRSAFSRAVWEAWASGSPLPISWDTSPLESLDRPPPDLEGQLPLPNPTPCLPFIA
jgi:hypothetical protein